MKPFAPKADATSNVAATTTTGPVALSKTPTGQFQVRVVNPGTTTAFVAFGASTITADVTTDIPIRGGSDATFTLESTDAAPITHAAAIMASSTASIYFSVGSGF